MAAVKVSERDKRSVACPACSRPAGRACMGQRIPSPYSFGGGWGGPPDLDRAHAARRVAYLATLTTTQMTTKGSV